MADRSRRGRPADSISESLDDAPLPSPPSSTATWSERIGTVNMPQSQNMVNQGRTVVNFTVNSADGELTPTTNQQEDLPDLTTTARADHEIYSDQLLTKKRGYPLWVPGPGMQLPIEYRRQGISIGDVGIITSSGEFDFLFNIFQPANHPINRGLVPPGFTPLSLKDLQYDIQKTKLYGPDTYLASSSVRKTSSNWIGQTLFYSSNMAIGQRFESTATEAAILIMPDGATTQNLLNTWLVRQTIIRDARVWYRYARYTRGRIVKDGDIRVVVGFDKVTSWGIATSTCNTGQTASFVLKHDSTHLYRWDCIGGSGRVGPQKEEIDGLIEDSDNAVPQNQSVFVRTLNFTFSGDIWDDLTSEAIQEIDPESSGFDYRDSPSSNQGGSGGGHGSLWSGSASSGQSGPMPGSLHCKQSVKFDPVELGVNHPSATLHNRLHDKFPDANMVITEDMDWISVLHDHGVVFPEPEDLCERILKSHELENHLGIIQLVRKDDTKLRPSSRDEGGNAGKDENADVPELKTVTSSLHQPCSIGHRIVAPDFDWPTPDTDSMPLHSEAQTTSHMMKTTKRGRPFLKDTLDLFATLVVSLELGPHKESFEIYPHSFTTDEAVQNLGSLKFSRSNRGPDPRDSSRVVTTITTTTFSMTREMAKATCQHFMDARLIENASDPQSNFLKDPGVYQLTPKGLHVLECFMSQNGINSDHLQPVFISQPICMNLLHLERHSSDDEIIVTHSVITALFRHFAGRAPNPPPSDKPLDAFRRHNERAKGIGVNEIAERARPLLGKPSQVHNYCFPAVSALEWLCDFSTVVGREEAAKIAAQFVRFGLITLVSNKRKNKDSGGDLPGPNFNVSQTGEFCFTTKAIYKVTEEGRRVAQWDRIHPTATMQPDLPSASSTILSSDQYSVDSLVETSDEKTKPPKYSKIERMNTNFESNEKIPSKESNAERLNRILGAPPLRSLFREFLRSNLCEDNLSFWLDVQDFKKKFNITSSAIAAHPAPRGSNRIMERHHESLVNTAFAIYNTYLTPFSPSKLNIDYRLRTELHSFLEEVVTESIGKPFQGQIDPEQAASFNTTQLQTMIRHYERIQIHVFRLMATDSVPKFITKFLDMRSLLDDLDPDGDDEVPFL